MARRHRFILLAALGGLLGTAAAEEPAVFQIVARDGRLAPAKLDVPAGRKLKFLIRNEGPGPAEFESAELRVEKVLSPGASSFVIVAPLKPGRYRFFDEFHPATSEMQVVAK